MAKEENGKKKLEKAIQAGRERDYKKAALILTELISASDAPPEAYLFLGRSLHALKDYARALASFNDYVRLKPRSVPGYLFAGRTYLALGMPHKAVPIFRKALELSGRDTAIMALLGTAYLKSKHSQAASDILQQAVEIAAADGLPQDTQKRLYHAYINALFIRGIRLCRSEDYNLGRQMLAFVLENGGDGPLLRLELGRACRELGQNEEALDHYTKALMYAPDDLRIRWYRASVLMTLGDTERARREIEFIRAASAGSRENIPANLPWNSALVDFFMIRAFLDSGEWRRAADACRDWIKEAAPDERDKSPAREAMIHAMYAEALRNLKNYSAALNHLNRALEIDPNQVQLWYEKILVAWEGENWKELRKSLRSAKNLGGDSDLIRRFSILLEAKTGEDDVKIIGVLQNAIRTLGPEPELMYALGERYLKIGLADLALSWFRKIHKVQENHERSWLGEIAALEVTEHNARELRSAYDHYVSRWPGNLVIRRERALYLIHTFEYKEAVKELETLLAWEPSNPSLRRVLAYGYRKTGRFREASVFLKGLLKEKPRNVGLLLEYSGCLERAGAPAYAIAVLEKALVLITTSPEIPMALGLLYSRERKLEKAFDYLREAAARNKRDPRPYHLMASLAKKKGNTEAAKKFEYEASKRSKK